MADLRKEKILIDTSEQTVLVTIEQNYDLGAVLNLKLYKAKLTFDIKVPTFGESSMKGNLGLEKQLKLIQSLNKVFHFNVYILAFDNQYLTTTLSGCSFTVNFALAIPLVVDPENFYEELLSEISNSLFME